MTPIKFAKFLKDGIKQPFFPITTEKAVYDSQGGGSNAGSKDPNNRW